jgi:hypothetical protein
MFQELTMTGGEAHVSWAYHTAAVCRAWTVHKTDQGKWTLVATVQRADPFKLQQRPLYFSAPRKGGRWCWPVKAVTLEGERLTAALAPMEA